MQHDYRSEKGYLFTSLNICSRACNRLTLSLFWLLQAPTNLEDDPNSFYCTTNSPLVTDIFDEHLTDTYVDQGDERCDKARRICQLCLLRACRVKHIDWNMRLPFTAAESKLIRFHAWTGHCKPCFFSCWRLDLRWTIH